MYGRSSPCSGLQQRRRIHFPVYPNGKNACNQDSSDVATYAVVWGNASENYVFDVALLSLLRRRSGLSVVCDEIHDLPLTSPFAVKNVQFVQNAKAAL